MNNLFEAAVLSWASATLLFMWLMSLGNPKNKVVFWISLMVSAATGLAFVGKTINMEHPIKIFLAYALIILIFDYIQYKIFRS